MIFTVTIATPAVFSAIGHGLTVGDKIRLTTTGALPTGLSVGTDYYIISAGLTANAFQVSTTYGGTAINTSGSQSGVHTFTQVTAVAHALTTKIRVKQKIGIPDATTTSDTLIDRLISGVTDFIEKYCGDRRFKQQTSISEIQSAEADSQKHFFLKQAPASSLTTYYNSGTVATPNWTAYPTEDYQLDEDGKSGIVRIYGGVGKGTNVVKFVYTAGYLIDFTNELDTTKHTLPFDLAEAADRMVIRWYKKREAAGKVSESYEGGSVNWRDTLDEDDKATLDSYRRVPFV